MTKDVRAVLAQQHGNITSAIQVGAMCFVHAWLHKLVTTMCRHAICRPLSAQLSGLVFNVILKNPRHCS